MTKNTITLEEFRRSFLLERQDFSTSGNKLYGMSYEKQRFCVKCQEREPPVDTVLEPGVNISEARYNRSDYTCDECYKERQKRYQSRGKFAEYRERLKEETIEQFAEEWNDPAYAKTKEIADRVRKVWDKYDRRSPDKGIRRDWLCEVIFSDLWYIDANGIVENWFNETGKSKIQRQQVKNLLLEFVSNPKTLELLGGAYKDKARNKWAGIVDAIGRKYSGREKMVARPCHIDPQTKDNVDNWYLLSREPERQVREAKRNALIERLNHVTGEEDRIVQRRKEVIERRDKAKQQEREREDDEDTNEGGETK